MMKSSMSQMASWLPVEVRTQKLISYHSLNFEMNLLTLFFGMTDLGVEIPYSTVFRISQGFFSIYYLLSVSNCHFLGLTCNSEEKSNFAVEDDIRETVAFRAGTQGDLTQIFPTF